MHLHHLLPPLRASLRKVGAGTNVHEQLIPDIFLYKPREKRVKTVWRKPDGKCRFVSFGLIEKIRKTPPDYYGNSFSYLISFYTCRLLSRYRIDKRRNVDSSPLARRLRRRHIALTQQLGHAKRA